MENITDYKPSFLIYGENAYQKDFPFDRNIGYYSKSYYCEENYIIHTNEKQVLNCEYCSKKYK